MKFFALENSLDEKIMGKIPQIKEFIHHCNIDEEPNHIDKYIFEKIEIQPILSNIVLYANAKQTDFINTYGNVGFGFGNLISDKLKLILEDFNCYGFQFFKTYILQNNKKNDNYCQTNIYDFPYQFIDFKNTIVSLKDGITRKVVSEPSNISNLEDFQSLINSLEFPISISLSNLSFNKNMDLDFFTLRFFENGGSNGIVSEKLKNELEKNEITGIEFRPIELSLREWYDSSDREKTYGKI